MSSLIVEICKIDAVEHHPNADRLDIVHIKGWNCIVSRDEFKAETLAIYVPPDSIIPKKIIEEYNLEYLKDNGRLRSVRLRGFLSQGLVLPLSLLPPETKIKEGTNVAETLNIEKWIPPQPKYAIKKSSKKKANPLFSEYTDIANIKHYNRVFTTKDDVVMTEKLHGTNFRFGNLPVYKYKGFVSAIKYYINCLLGKKYEYIYGSRHVQIMANNLTWYGEDVYGKVAEKYKLKNIIPPNTILYGEIVGPGIQDLTYGLTEHKLFVFDIKQDDRYLNHEAVVKFCKEHGLEMVPILFTGKYSNKKLAKHTAGNSVICPTQIREGCVVKPLVEMNDNKIGRKILKSVGEQYVLRNSGTEYN